MTFNLWRKCSGRYCGTCTKVLRFLTFTSLYFAVYGITPVTVYPTTTAVPTHGGIEVSANSTTIHVSWEVYQGATDYHVIHGLTSNTDSKDVTITNGNTNSVLLPADPNKMYTIGVVAILPQNVLRHIGEINITTDNGVFVTEITSNSANIWWGSVDNVDEYHVLYHPSDDMLKKIALIVRTTQMLITDLQPNTEYGIEVVAILKETEQFQPVGEVIITTEGTNVNEPVNIALIAGSIAGGLLVLIIIVTILICCCWQRKCCQEKQPATGQSTERVYDDIDDTAHHANISSINLHMEDRNHGATRPADRAPRPLPNPEGHKVLSPHDNTNDYLQPYPNLSAHENDVGYVTMRRAETPAVQTTDIE